MARLPSKQIFIRTVLSVAIALAFIAYIYAHRHSMGTIFRGISAKFLILIVLSQITVQLANAELLRVSTRPFIAKLKLMEAFGITLAASSVNFFTPVIGGIAVKAVYLKRYHQLNYATYTSVIYANYLISFLFSFLFGLLGLAIVHSSAGAVALFIAALFFGSGAVLCILFMVFGHKVAAQLTKLHFKNSVLAKFIKNILKVNTGWEMIRGDRRLLAGMSLWSAIAMTFTAVTYAFVMRSLNISASASAVLILAALGNVSLLVNITPGNIGIRETIYASVYGVTAISLQSVVAFSLLERSTLILILAFGWLVFGRKILAQVKEPKHEVQI